MSKKSNLRNIPRNQSTYNTYELDILNSLGFNKNNKRKWYRYLQVLNQMIGLISVRGNEVFENRANQLFECCYANGHVVLTFIDGKLQLWTIAGEVKPDINGGYEYVNVIPYVGLGYMGTNSKDMKQVKFSGDNVVIIKAGAQGFSLWMLWDTILTDNCELMEIYLTNAKLNIKKLQYVVNNESESIVADEIQSILDYTSPVLLTINPITKSSKGDIREMAGEQNVLEPLELSSGNYYFDDVVNHWVFETNLMGLYADEYRKKERNTSGENEMTQANTILLHEVYLREFKKAEKEIKEKFGVDVEFYKTFELSTENNNKNEKEVKDEVK